MTTLATAPNIDRPDDLYEEIIEAHSGLSDEQSRMLDAAIVLILANHIGDRDVITEAVAIARKAVCDPASETETA